MPGEITLKLPRQLQEFVDSRIGEDGLYETHEEYLRDLVRREFQQDESNRWIRFVQEMKPRLDTPESEFEEVSVDDILIEAKSEYEKNEI